MLTAQITGRAKARQGPRSSLSPLAPELFVAFLGLRHNFTVRCAGHDPQRGLPGTPIDLPPKSTLATLGTSIP